MTDDKLTPERAVRLLRAKAAELESSVRDAGYQEDGLEARVTWLAADIALVAQLLADHIERTEEGCETAMNRDTDR